MTQSSLLISSPCLRTSRFAPLFPPVLWWLKAGFTEEDKFTLLQNVYSILYINRQAQIFYFLILSKCFSHEKFAHIVRKVVSFFPVLVGLCPVLLLLCSRFQFTWGWDQIPDPETSWNFVLLIVMENVRNNILNNSFP
jgi:hypothetical protein